MTEPLANWTLFRLLACLAIVVVPHFRTLPVWASVLVTIMLAWRGLAAVFHWRMPSAWLRGALAIAAFVALYLSYGKMNSQEAGAGLLVVMVAFKLTEMSRVRDCSLVLMLSYFILVTHFLVSQEIGTAVYVFGSVVLVTALLLEISHPQGPLAAKITIKNAAVLVAQAVPLMLLMFVLFPRIPGPLWGIPHDQSRGRTGLSNSMEPGSISKLGLSDEVAMRVTFLDKAPDPKQRYWRGPIFWTFDGRGWNPGQESAQTPDGEVEPLGPAIRQEVMLEPHSQNWLLALDLPMQGPPGSSHDNAQQLLSSKPILERQLYQVTSYTQYRYQTELPKELRARALQMPRFGNLRLRELAEQWRETERDDRSVVDAALGMFNREDFYYTLEPPLLTKTSSMDDFLFNTRRGFCEHYAGAFTLLMRAAGIPARIVTGYQGGEYNAAGGYFIIRQSDAHAWSEVWLPDEGWVRIDPTAAVAPQRIESGLASALSEEEAGALRRGSNDVYLIYQLEAYWDWTNAVWNRSILAYGPELQQRFLERFGIRDWYQMTLALTIFVVSFLAILGGILLWQARPQLANDPALREWERFCRTLARHKLARHAYEGPCDYAQRACLERPDLAADVARISGLYIRLRYIGSDNDAETLRQLKDSVRSFKP
jgi:protein-glutamine gamma-glutamyltransferase